MKNSHLTKYDYEDIKRLVGMQQAAEYYGYHVDRQGRCLCPFHKDQHPSMKIYPHDKGYYCFSCGAGGDVVKFVAVLYGLENEAAAHKLIEDFSLQIKTEGLSYREKREQESKIKRIREMQEFSQRADRIMMQYRRKLCEAARDPESAYFTEAMQMLCIVEYRLECLKECPEEMYADKKVVRWIGTIEQRLAGWDLSAAGRTAVSG